MALTLAALAQAIVDDSPSITTIVSDTPVIDPRDPRDPRRVRIALALSPFVDMCMFLVAKAATIPAPIREPMPHGFTNEENGPSRAAPV